MTSKNIYKSLGGLDPALIENAAPKERVQKKNVILKWAALAACLALIITAVIGGTFLTDSNTFMISGNNLTGKRMLMLGEPVSFKGNGGFSITIGPCFYMQTVIEAKVVEVLPDTYYDANTSRAVHVARLRVVEQVRGGAVPKEIFLQYPYYDTTVFEGYDRFILSIDQVGIENYALINDTARRMDYFSNMFEVSLADLGYGSVIAFNDGRVDDSFWEKAKSKSMLYTTIDELLDSPSDHHYPASRNSTVTQVKRAIHDLDRMAQEEDEYEFFFVIPPCEYVTAEDLFLTAEAKEIEAYIKPGGTTVFTQELFIMGDEIEAHFTRMINGFSTDEHITIRVYDDQSCEVTRRGEEYTPEELLAAPDIGQVLEEMEVSALQPPHFEEAEEHDLRWLSVSGTYRKAEGRVYGIVRVLWLYGVPNIKDAYEMDDLYYLYDAAGGRVVSREDLHALFGDDSFIEDFSYDAYFTVLC